MIVDNWRTSHAWPLNSFQITLRRRAQKIEPDALVAQRLKRFISVMNKLAREPDMKLSQMQDLGGCRAIMADVAGVNSLYDQYRNPEVGLFESEDRLRCKDYIRSPKPDGYRGIHIVGRYRARLETREHWNGHCIEVQLRSRLQHAIATTVETVTTFTREPLKFGSGPEEWKRFFSLMGSALALREGTTLIPGTPQNPDHLIRELREAAKRLRVRERLKGWANALRSLPRRNIQDYRWLLLVLDVKANTIKVVGYENGAAASARLAEIEQRPGVGGNLDAVLVNVFKIQDLRKAYPNYYADTAEFINALDHAVRV